MKLHTETVELPGKIGAHFAYPARAKEPLPGVIVIQEIWGVDAHIRDVTERFAAAGYAALAPDLFSRGGGRPAELSEPRMDAAKAFLDQLPPGAWANLMDPAKRDAELARLPEGDRGKMGETIGSLFSPQRFGMMPAFAQDLEAAAGWLRARPEVGGRKIGAVGYCMGGGLAGMLAARDPQLAASVIYYGQLPAGDGIAKLHCPVLVLFAEHDERLVMQLPDFEKAMKQAGKSYDAKVYAGASHAFFNDTRSSYHVAASRDAWARTLELFARTLA